MPYSYFNHSLISSGDFKLNSSNRLFRFGDGLFETVFVSRQIPLFIHLHLNRLFKGMQFMQINRPENWDVGFFSSLINELAIKNNFINARCRITVWRGGEGYYMPVTNEPEFLIELTELNNASYSLNDEGLKIGVFNNIPKLLNLLSGFKTAQSLPYIMASIYAREQNLDDVVLLNNAGRVADATSSNLFIYENRRLYTPSAEEGGIEGVMQKVVIALCRLEGIEIYETKIEIKDLLDADELFLTNAINGIKWVSSFQNKKYNRQFAADLNQVLNEQKNNNSLVSS